MIAKLPITSCTRALCSLRIKVPIPFIAKPKLRHRALNENCSYLVAEGCFLNRAWLESPGRDPVNIDCFTELQRSLGSGIITEFTINVKDYIFSLFRSFLTCRRRKLMSASKSTSLKSGEFRFVAFLTASNT